MKRCYGAIVLLLCSGCAHNYRLEQTVSPLDEPTRELIHVQWAKQLVEDEFLAYKRQERATASFSSDGRLFIGSSSGAFISFDEDGRRRWLTRLGGAISSEPLYEQDSDVILVGADDGKLYAISAFDGRVLWDYATEGAITPKPALSQGLALFSSSEDRVYALNASDGSWRWQVDQEKPEGFTIQGYAGVTADAKTAYCGFSNGHLLAINVTDGSVLWERSLAGEKRRFVDVNNTPLLYKNIVFASSYASGIYAISAQTGSVEWHLPVEGASRVVALRNRLYFTAPRVGLVALDLRGKQIWRQAIAQGVPGHPVVFDDHLLVTGTETGMFVADAHDGHLVQFFAPGSGISAMPAVGFDMIAVLSNRGRLYAFARL